MSKVISLFCKCLAVLLLQVFGANILFAQEKDGSMEVAMSYGLLSGTQLIIPTLGYNVNEDAGYTPGDYTANYFGTFRLYVEDDIALGGTIGYQSMAFVYSNTGAKRPSPSYSMKTDVYTVSFEIKLSYFKRIEYANGASHPHKYYDIYCMLGVGGRYFDEVRTPHTEIPTMPTYFINTQITPLGIRIGRGISIFGEFGFGYKGVANFGCAFKIRPKK